MRYTIFETANGYAAIGWQGESVTRFRLPAESARETEEAIQRRWPGATPGAPSEAIARVIADTQRYFTGERIDFAYVPVDLGPQEALYARIYAHIRRLGWGEATSYGAIAKDLGLGPEYARTVGQAMGRNPVPLIVPCHRVLAAGGRIGGFSAPGGSDSKARMLELEGVAIAESGAPTRDTAQISFGF